MAIEGNVSHELRSQKKEYLKICGFAKEEACVKANTTVLQTQCLADTTSTENAANRAGLALNIVRLFRNGCSCSVFCSVFDFEHVRSFVRF